jgi:hypothetical protein
VARRESRGRSRSYTLAIVSGLALSPILWQQYFALLFAPIAVYRRRLAPVWLLPLAYWLAPYNPTDGHSLNLVWSGLGAAGFQTRLAQLRPLRTSYERAE